VFADIGRVDAPLKTPSRIHAYAEAVKVLSPVHIGDRFRLHGSWGQDDATVQSFDQWNGRIVAVLAVSPHVDSLARGKAPLVALAVRADALLAHCRRRFIALGGGHGGGEVGHDEWVGVHLGEGRTVGIRASGGG